MLEFFGGTPVRVVCDNLKTGAFGKIIEGMDVVNKIAETATDFSDRPLEDQRLKTVTVDCFGVEYPEPEKQNLTFCSPAFLAHPFIFCSYLI